MVTRETELRQGLLAMGLEESPGIIDALVDLHNVLAEEAIPNGLLGPAEADRLIPRHLLESAALLPHLAPAGPCIDVGSGAGLPGLVLSILGRRPVTVLDSDRRRTRFSERAARRLSLDVAVERGRAEELGRLAEHRERYSSAVARALAPPRVALEYLLPFVRVGGRAVLAVGPSAADELAQAEDAACCLGGGRPSLVRLEVPGLEGERWAMIVEKNGACPERYPRRVGVPARRPLGGG